MPRGVQRAPRADRDQFVLREHRRSRIVALNKACTARSGFLGEVGTIVRSEQSALLRALPARAACVRPVRRSVVAVSVRAGLALACLEGARYCRHGSVGDSIDGTGPGARSGSDHPVPLSGPVTGRHVLPDVPWGLEWVVQGIQAPSDTRVNHHELGYQTGR